MSSTSRDSIRIRRGELNGKLCNMFRDALLARITAHPKFKERKDLDASKRKDSNRPIEMPEGSIFLYAEQGPEDSPVMMGSICLNILHATGRYYQGLPEDLEKVGEIKRTIVLDDFQRRGIGFKLVKEIERIARDELGLRYMAVETWWELKAARTLYEGLGYERREPWGMYDSYDSCCYGKWLIKGEMTSEEGTGTGTISRASASSALD